MSASVSSINVLSVFFIVIAIMVIAGVFVANDAKKRGMNPVGWGLVAAFGPFLIGVIVYLVSRQPIVEFSCSNCGEGVDKDVNICPHCGSTFNNKCLKCGFTLDSTWSSCPKCGENVENSASKIVPTYKKSKSSTFAIVLIGIIAIILVTTVSVVPVLFMTSEQGYLGSGETGYIGMGNITKEDLSVNENIAKWINDCSEADEDVCVLISKKSGTGIIYLKGVDELCELNGEVEYNTKNELNIIFTVEPCGIKNNYGFDFYVFEADFDYDVNISANLPDEYDAKVNITYTDNDISRDSWRR